MGFRNFFVMHVGGLHVLWCIQQKFESVYVIKKYRNKLLFSYYELGLRCFELNLFSHCFGEIERRWELLKQIYGLNKMLFQLNMISALHIFTPNKDKDQVVPWDKGNLPVFFEQQKRNSSKTLTCSTSINPIY